MTLPFPIPMPTHLPVFPHQPEKIPVHRNTLINRIFQLIAIVNNYEERELLKALPNVTIPYYLLGADEDLCNEFRMHIAEIIYASVFEYPAIDIHPISGQRISRLAVPTQNILRWRVDAGKAGWILDQPERDFVSYWSNVAHVIPGHSSISLWGNHAYVDGYFYERIVDGYFIKSCVGFIEDEHEIVHGDPFPIERPENDMFEQAASLEAAELLHRLKSQR